MGMLDRIKLNKFFNIVIYIGLSYSPILNNHKKPKLKMKNKFKILIACEFSGHIREAFIRKGFVNTYSCDLLPSNIASNNHIQGDVLNIINDNWNLIISHPPCTYLTRAAATFAFPKGILDKERYKKTLEAREFFFKFVNCNAKYLCIENPIPLRIANLPNWTQITSPDKYGDIYQKKTCLWLKNLPKLIETYQKNKGKTFMNYYVKGKSYGDKRSITSKFMADEMANQWGNYLLNPIKTLF